MVINNHKDLNKKLKEVYKKPGPILIDVKIDPKSRVAPKIEFGKPLHDMSPSLPDSLIKKLLKNK